MRWLVTTQRPGRYQPDNPLRNWALQQLVVQAPTALDAERHVIRTVQGDLGAIVVVPFDGVLGQPPVTETVPDPPTQHIVIAE